jgi:hypothetical protein
MSYVFSNNSNIYNSNGTPITANTRLPVDIGNNTVGITGNVTISTTASQTSAFGEPYGITITPVLQADAIYGITTEVVQTYTSGSGSSANSNLQIYKVETGNTVGGYGVLRSKRFLRYRPGQGALSRFTAAFSNGVSQSTQRAGLFNQENAIMFGYNGTDFGVMRATGGKAEIRQLTINSISSGSQTITVTLNDTAYTVTGVNTANTTQAAVAIANRVGGFDGYLIDQVDNTIVFLAPGTSPQTGTFSATGSGTFSGSFARLQAGIAQTENWTKQENWNVDTLGANTQLNPSGMTLNKDNLNVYQIQFRWLGAGQISYAVEDSNTGNMIHVHKEHYVGTNTAPHLANPSFKIGYVAYSTGSTTNLAVTGASMFGAIEGTIFQNELNRSTSVSKTTLGSGTVWHLMTIRNPYVTNGKSGALNGNYVLNAKEVILKDISIGVQGNDPGIVYIFYEPTSFSNTHVYTSQPKDNVMVSTVDGTLDPTVDTAVTRFVTAINGEAQYDLSKYRIAIPSGSYVSIAIQSTSNMSRVSAAVVFSED